MTTTIRPMSLPSSASDSRQRGSVLVIGVLVLLLVSSLTLGYMRIARTSSTWTSQQSVDLRLETAAESVASMAVTQLWDGFRTAFPDDTTSRWDFRFYMDGLGINDQADAANPVPTDILAMLNLPLDDEGQSELSDVVIDSATVWREDTWNQTHVFVEVVARDRTDQNAANPAVLRRTVSEVYTVAAPEWDGLDFALLANNINCVMCHTEVDNAQRFYNASPDNYNTFDRVKIGSLESFQLREDPHSWIAGTLYIAGAALEEDGSALTDWAGHNFKSRSFDGYGKLQQDTWGDMTETDLSPADPDGPQPFENLYVGYGDERFDGVDGDMTETFPSPFPDDGGYDMLAGGPVAEDADNRLVDDAEFATAVASSRGTISGGTISVFGAGSSIETSAELETVTTTGNTANLEAVVDGAVYLHGTPENPIRLNGNVAIDGDLVIHGHVEGAGSLRVRGNVYMPSDLVYADGTDVDGNRTYGYAADGTENLVAIAAGGNTMIGDIFHPSWGEGDLANGEEDGSFNFIMDEIALFNRMEWMKTQEELPGKRQKVKVGEKDYMKKVWDYVWEEYQKEVPTYKWVSNGLPAPYTKKVKVKTGTKWVTRRRKVKVGEPRLEPRTKNVYEWQTPMYPNPHYDAEYLPRYYSFTEDSSVIVYNKDGHFDPESATWLADERAGEWSTNKLTVADPKDTSDDLLYDASGQPKAVVYHLTATSDWISDELLQELMETNVTARDEETAFEIDATLYSNNSIFGILPARNAPGMNGELLINGGMVAADIGLLAPTRFQLNYDPRGKELLDIFSDSSLSIRRQVWLPPSEN